MARQAAELLRHRGALLGVAGFTVLALLLTGMVAGTLSRSQDGDTIEVTAVFRDATGLRVGDDVRVAGVRVGRVTGTELGTGRQRGLALVTLDVAADAGLRADSLAQIDYLNLMGQRFVSLSRPDVPGDAVGARAGAGPEMLAEGDTIDLDSTRPALDLTALFNAFRPVFDLIRPEDVNELAGNIVAVLQGQGPTLRSLLDQTGELTEGLVERDAALADVVDNVSRVLDTTVAHRDEITRLLDGLGTLSEGVAADRRRIATSLDSLTRLSTTTADLIEDAGPSFVEDAALSRAWFRYLRENEDALVTGGLGLPKQLKVYLRTLGYGSYLNVYICTLQVRAKGFDPSFDLGLGDAHTERCR